MTPPTDAFAAELNRRMGASQVARRIAEAAERGHVQLVPQIQVGATGTGGGQDRGMLGALMGLMLKSGIVDGLGSKQTPVD